MIELWLIGAFIMMVKYLIVNKNEPSFFPHAKKWGLVIVFFTWPWWVIK